MTETRYDFMKRPEYTEGVSNLFSSDLVQTFVYRNVVYQIKTVQKECKRYIFKANHPANKTDTEISVPYNLDEYCTKYRVFFFICLKMFNIDFEIYTGHPTGRPTGRPLFAEVRGIMRPLSGQNAYFISETLDEVEKVAHGGEGCRGEFSSLEYLYNQFKLKLGVHYTHAGDCSGKVTIPYIQNDCERVINKFYEKRGKDNEC